MTDYVEQVHVLLPDEGGGWTNGGTPSCLINLDRSISHSTNFQENEVPECQDEAAPASVHNMPRSIALGVSGTGVLDLDEYPDWVNRWKNGTLTEMRIELPPSTENPGLRYQGLFYVENIDMNKAYKGNAEVTISLRPRNAREVEITSIPIPNGD